MKRISILFLFFLIIASGYSFKVFSKIIDCPKPPGNVRMGEIINKEWSVGYNLDGGNKYKIKINE